MCKKFRALHIIKGQVCAVCLLHAPQTKWLKFLFCKSDFLPRMLLIIGSWAGMPIEMYEMALVDILMSRKALSESSFL